jgi:hypothetical protein
VEKLVTRVKQVEVFQSESVNRYLFRFHPYGWAIFYVDHEWGGLTITSDWGSWSHVWGGGPKTWGNATFVDFLKDRTSCHYLADKLSYGRTRQVPDPDATFKALGSEIIYRRRAGDLNRDKARELWHEMNNFCDMLNDSLDAAYGVLESGGLAEEFDGMHEWVVYVTAPKVTFLIEGLLPVFVAHLNGELEELNGGGMVNGEQRT